MIFLHATRSGADALCTSTVRKQAHRYVRVFSFASSFFFPCIIIELREQLLELTSARMTNGHERATELTLTDITHFTVYGFSRMSA